MAKKKNKKADKELSIEARLGAVLSEETRKFLEENWSKDESEDEPAGIVISAYANLLALWTKVIAKMEAVAMRENESLKPLYEAEQVVLVMLAEYGDRLGLDFGRFLKMVKDEDGVWHLPDEPINE